ncbi:hypothetical protein GLOIN_2v1874127 [Rhizophagus clarus]|uniref:Ion transport domain-containing protein n=1 Tax=Rhizophagus clarus TaxID=94130 RepID=A0A8H3L1M1_9GLOM|nr:hypothetical protein GLOIN_2v1874127 [Rhizophagus clarus]
MSDENKSAKVEIDIDKSDDFEINIDKIDNDNDIDPHNDKNDIDPHNGKDITKMEISAKEEHLVTYSKDDNSIVYWDIEKKRAEFRVNVKLGRDTDLCIRISDNKKLAIDNGSHLRIYDMENNQEIKLENLDCHHPTFDYRYFTFNLNDEFILYERDNNIVLFYSTQTKNKKWKCKRMYKIPKDFELISVSKDDKLYLFSNDHSIYAWDLVTEKNLKILSITEELPKDLGKRFKKHIRFYNDENFICIYVVGKIPIFSTKMETHIGTLYNSKAKTDETHVYYYAWRLPSLRPLLNNIDVMLEYVRSKSPEDLKDKDKIQITTKYALGIQKGRIWKMDLEESLAGMDLTIENLKNPSEFLKYWDEYFGNNSELIRKTFKVHGVKLFGIYKPFLDNINELFEEVIDGKHEEERKKESSLGIIRWEIIIERRILKLKAFITIHGKVTTLTRDENLNDRSMTARLLGIKLFSQVNIIILTTKGLFIYFIDTKNESESNVSIILFYYYYMEINDENVEECKNFFLKPTLPLPNYNSFKFCEGFVSDIQSNDKNVIYYEKLLTFGIKEHKFDLINKIYENSLKKFKYEDETRDYLTIITSTMPLLKEYYPEFISKYSSDTSMIIDSYLFNVKDNDDSLHLYSFRHLHIVNLTRSIWWFSKRTKTKTITFMNPYIGFVNYPPYDNYYDWFIELFRPQPSPFVESISREIYKTWDGETLINFKWNHYGKYYYSIIWIGFMFLLGCFTAAATIPQQYIDDDVRKKLLIASIILGFIHLSFEVRHFIYSPIKWLTNFWNIFESNFSFDEFNTNNNDPNNPWNIAPAYHQVFENGTVDPNPFIIQQPDENTNMFVDFGTSIFAMYKFLTGDSSALSNWAYKDDPSLAILIVLFSFLIVVYLMNLFIGLLNNEIEKDNDRVSYLMQKAEILAEIELFYLLPHQRRWKTWFPEKFVLRYYYADDNKTRQKIKEMRKKSEWSTSPFTKLRETLLKQLKIEN